MSDKKDIKDAVRQLAKPNHNGYGVLCTVDSITDNKCYCIPLNGDADIQGVRIVPDVSNKWSLIPKIGSIVIVDFLSDSSGYIAQVSEVDFINLNGDNFDGLVKLNDLVTQLNNLETAVNNHITLYNAHTHGGVTVGAGVTAVPVVPDTQTLTPTVAADIENTTVKQGDGT